MRDHKAIAISKPGTDLTVSVQSPSVSGWVADEVFAKVLRYLLHDRACDDFIDDVQQLHFQDVTTGLLDPRWSHCEPKTARAGSNSRKRAL